MKLQQNQKNGQFYINLPKSLIEAKRWEKGRTLKIRFNERGNLELEEN